MQEKWIKNSKPQTGDILKVRRKAGYCHFGIAVSSKEVIHFTGLQGDDITNPDNIKIRKTGLSMFVREDELEILDSWSSPFTAKEVVKRAKTYLESSYFKGKQYNFLTNNCEHFARFCYYGDPECTQVKTGIATAAVLTGAFVTAAAVAVGKSLKNKTKKS